MRMKEKLYRAFTGSKPNVLPRVLDECAPEGDQPKKKRKKLSERAMQGIATAASIAILIGALSGGIVYYRGYFEVQRSQRGDVLAANGAIAPSDSDATEPSITEDDWIFELMPIAEEDIRALVEEQLDGAGFIYECLLEEKMYTVRVAQRPDWSGDLMLDGVVLKLYEYYVNPYSEEILGDGSVSVLYQDELPIFAEAFAQWYTGWHSGYTLLAVSDIAYDFPYEENSNLATILVAMELEEYDEPVEFFVYLAGTKVEDFIYVNPSYEWLARELVEAQLEDDSFVFDTQMTDDGITVRVVREITNYSQLGYLDQALDVSQLWIYQYTVSLDCQEILDCSHVTWLTEDEVWTIAKVYAERWGKTYGRECLVESLEYNFRSGLESFFRVTFWDEDPFVLDVIGALDEYQTTPVEPVEDEIRPEQAARDVALDQFGLSMDTVTWLQIEEWDGFYSVCLESDGCWYECDVDTDGYVLYTKIGTAEERAGADGLKAALDLALGGSHTREDIISLEWAYDGERDRYETVIYYTDGSQSAGWSGGESYYPDSEWTESEQASLEAALRYTGHLENYLAGLIDVTVTSCILDGYDLVEYRAGTTYYTVQVDRETGEVTECDGKAYDPSTDIAQEVLYAAMGICGVTDPVQRCDCYLVDCGGTNAYFLVALQRPNITTLTMVDACTMGCLEGGSGDIRSEDARKAAVAYLELGDEDYERSNAMIGTFSDGSSFYCVWIYRNIADGISDVVTVDAQTGQILSAEAQVMTWAE